MADVIAKIKIMPEGTDTDLDKLKKELTSSMPLGARLSGWGEEKIAFGLKALIATVVVGDAEGGTQAVEDVFAKVKGVQSVQVVGLGRAII
jgi:elongation factor 1-beta